MQRQCTSYSAIGVGKVLLECSQRDRRSDDTAVIAEEETSYSQEDGREDGLEGRHGDEKRRCRPYRRSLSSGARG